MSPRHLLLLLTLACTALPSTADIPARPQAAPGSLLALRMGAEAGDAEAMVGLGWRLYHGQGAPNDDSAAVRWFRSAAEKGSADGLYGLAWCQRSGRGMTADREAADTLMRKAAELGSADAQNDVGQTLSSRGELEAAHAWYAKAAAQGHTDAMWHLGRNFLYGRGVTADAATGAAWLRKSAEAGNPVGMYYLGIALVSGTVLPRDLPAARSWFHRSMELGDIDARFELAKMMADGLGGKTDVGEALRLLRAGAGEGHGDSALALALMYADGKGVEEDAGEAERWLQKAVELGEPRALVRLGHKHLTGSDRPVDKPAAARLFLRAAEAGDAAGAFWIGQCLELGNGMPKDEAAAARWYTRASDEGVAPALNFLLAMRFAGRGVPQDRAGAEARVDQEIASGNAANMLDLATKMLSRGQVDDAGLVVRRVYAAPAPHGSRASAAFAEALGDLGMAYHGLQRHGPALIHLQAQLALLGSLPDTRPWRFALVHDCIGMIAWEQGRLDAAEASYRQALALRLRESGEIDQGVANSHAALAQLYVSRDQLGLAEFHRHQEVRITEALYGAASTEAASTRASLAQTLYVAGKYQEAQRLFEQALAAIESRLGKDNPRILTDLSNLAWNERAQHRFERAEAGFRRVLALHQAEYGDKPHHSVASALNSLGGALTGAGKLEEAERTLQAGLAMREQLLGPDHYDVAYSLVEVGRLYIAQGRHAEADRMLARAMAIIEPVTGREHSEVAAILHEQGRSQLAQGRGQAAEQAWQRALAIRLRARPGHPDTAETAALLAGLYRAAGDAAAAQAVAAKVAAAAREASSSGAAAVPAA